MNRTLSPTLWYVFGCGLLMLVLAGAVGCARSGVGGSSGRSAAINSYVQGVNAYQKGDRDAAISEFEQAVKQRQDMTMAHAMLGDLYQSRAAEQRDAAAARRAYEQALEQYILTSKLDPYSASNYANQGVVFHLLNRAQEAVAAYLRALKLNPQDFKSNMGLGAAYLSLNDPDDAVIYAQRATELNPKCGPAWSNYAVALDQLARYTEAEGAYRKALELDANQVDTAVALAGNLMRQHRLSEARSVMDNVVRMDDTAAHRKRLGDAMFLDKHYDEALDQYHKALELEHRYYPALNEIGWVLITQYNQSLGLDEKKRLAALEAWQKSLLINRNQPRITQLVQTYADRFSEDRP